jgi:hypothetical protein
MGALMEGVAIVLRRVALSLLVLTAIASLTI